jgi:CubicO group peptidase (beta-lactamase class C family)
MACRTRTPAALAALLAAVAIGAAAAPAVHAARSCRAPGATWQRATPAEAGMDAAKLQDALDYGTSQAGFALRVFRHGCLVGEDRLAALNGGTRFESWSMAKSVTSLVFGRAQTLGLISPDDPVGALVPEADRAHGAITMRDLLTMTSGLEWNGLRDYNIFTMPDRVRDALTLPPVHAPGTYFEYAQSPVALLAEAVGRAAGEDVGAFAQRELMDPLGIAAGAWDWQRDRAGHVQAFWGARMRPEDFARLGELLRRGGVWQGRRLLGRAYLAGALAPSATNGCYGWLIWLNAGAPCIGPTTASRPVAQTRQFPELPAELYRFSGLFGQLVTVFPSQGLVVVRLGQDPGVSLGGGGGWERELYRRVLAAVTDQQITPPPPASPRGDGGPNADYGFQTALLRPDQYSKGAVQDPLPPAGPERARAALLSAAGTRVSHSGTVRVRLACPARWPGRQACTCRGRATLTGARRPVRYRVTPGASRVLRFHAQAAPPPRPAARRHGDPARHRHQRRRRRRHADQPRHPGGRAAPVVTLGR